jgi:hypothetical protein
MNEGGILLCIQLIGRKRWAGGGCCVKKTTPPPPPPQGEYLRITFQYLELLTVTPYYAPSAFLSSFYIIIWG